MHESGCEVSKGHCQLDRSSAFSRLDAAVSAPVQQAQVTASRAEVDVLYSKNPSSAYPLGVALIPTGDGTGQLVLHWGPHVWTSGFSVGS